MRKLLIAGVAAVALAGASGLAVAQTSDTHVMTVRLPNGMIERIQYTGDVPPQIVLARQPVAIVSPFAMLEQMSADLNRQMAAMVQGMPPFPVGLMQAPLAAGGQGFGPVSSLPGSGVCMQSMRITFNGNGAQPIVERHSQGNCGTPDAEAPVAAPVAPAAPAVKPIEVKAGPSDLVKPVTAWRG